jgi:hypothetical protein
MGAVVSLLFASGDERVRRLVIEGASAQGVVECGGVDRRAVSNGGGDHRGPQHRRLGEHRGSGGGGVPDAGGRSGR